jgi:flavin-dependent dehydrogenase
MNRAETVIVGGGPAGAAAACRLAALGHEVVLFERTSGPHHKVCGEFISIDTQAQLKALGIDPAQHGAACIERLAVHTAAGSASVALPFTASSLSRYRLDELLIGAALAHGATVKRDAAVRATRRDKSGWQVEADGATVLCRNLILATGKRGLRGMADERDNSLVGLKMHLRPTPHIRDMLDGQVALVFFSSGYAGMEPVEGGIANLCLVLQREIVAQNGASWPALRDYLMDAHPLLAEVVTNAEPVFDKPLAVVCPDGSFLRRETTQAFPVGDRLAHIPPFTGDGLGIALRSAELAADHIREGSSPAAYLSVARKLLAPRLRTAGTIGALSATRLGQSLLMRAANHPLLLREMTRRTRLLSG